MACGVPFVSLDSRVSGSRPVAPFGRKRERECLCVLGREGKKKEKKEEEEEGEWNGNAGGRK